MVLTQETELIIKCNARLDIFRPHTKVLIIRQHTSVRTTSQNEFIQKKTDEIIKEYMKYALKQYIHFSEANFSRKIYYMKPKSIQNVINSLTVRAIHVTDGIQMKNVAVVE